MMQRKVIFLKFISAELLALKTRRNKRFVFSFASISLFLLFNVVFVTLALFLLEVFGAERANVLKHQKLSKELQHQ